MKLVCFIESICNGFFHIFLFRFSNITVFLFSERLIMPHGHQRVPCRNEEIYPQVDPFDPNNLTLKKAKAKSYVSRICRDFLENTQHQSKCNYFIIFMRQLDN